MDDFYEVQKMCIKFMLQVIFFVIRANLDLIIIFV